MEQGRILLAIVLSFVVFLAWDLLVVDRAPTQKTATDTAIRPQEATPTSEAPAAPQTDTLSTLPIPRGPSDLSDRPARVITVDTPIYTIQLNEKGATVESMVLKDFREKPEPGSALKEIVAPQVRGQGLMLSMEGGGLELLKTAVFRAEVADDRLIVSGRPLELVFRWVSETGIEIRKVFRFNPDSYLIDLGVDVINGSPAEFEGRLAISLWKQQDPKSKEYGFVGPAALIDNRLEQIDLKKVKESPVYEGTLHWMGMVDRYFLGVVIPEPPSAGQIKLQMVDEQTIEARLVLGTERFVPGQAKHISYGVFFGPKQLSLLKQIGRGLDEAVNFGWFDFLAKPFLWIMNHIYGVIPNYGVAIILLTVMTKILLWPLGSKSYKSMSEMKRIQPLMAEIREKYKKDKQKMNSEMMSLYRTYKINPMGGCLPMVVQIPVFFALYRMLYEAIELRHAPFVGWINDLSAPDRLLDFPFSIPLMEPPYGIPVLTIVMGATMFLQQKMSPAPGDPAQAKMMMFMPLIFTVIFINFSSGLVLYWLINNVLSIAQQYYIQKKYA
jgi:YidC/Oxa1 family membrane protein insertase